MNPDVLVTGDPPWKSCVFFPYKRQAEATFFRARSASGLWTECALRSHEEVAEITQWTGSEHSPLCRRLYRCLVTPEQQSEAFFARHGHLLRLDAKSLRALTPPRSASRVMQVKIVLPDGRVSTWDNQYETAWKSHYTRVQVTHGPTFHLDPVNLAALPALLSGSPTPLSSATRHDVLIGHHHLDYAGQRLELRLSRSQAERLVALQASAFYSDMIN